MTQYKMSGFQHNLQGVPKRQDKAQSEEKKQASEPNSDVTQMLKVPDREFRMTPINMVRVLREKVDIIQE